MKPERVHRLPAPGVHTHTRDVMPCLPAEQLFGQAWVGIAGSDIARTAGNDLKGHGFIGCGFKGFNHLEHRISTACAEIDCDETGLLQRLERGQVTGGQIIDVDVIAYPGAVRRRVVVTEDL